MRSMPVRFMNAVLWPFTIWMSLRHLEEHPADDYVERTSPIAATAVAFWICAMAAGAMWFAVQGQSAVMHVEGVDYAARVTRRGFQPVLNVALAFLPVIYFAGLWLYSTRDERFPR